LFACDPPAESVPLLEEIAADLRPESLRAQLFVRAFRPRLSRMRGNVHVRF
jgi:hypothetical protein